MTTGSNNNPTVPEWFATEHVQGVQHIFQDTGHVYGKFSRRKDITGSTEGKFKQYGLLTAGPKVGGKIPRQKGDHKSMTLSADKFFTGVEIDQFDLDRLDEDDRDAAKQAAGNALARKADEIWRNAAALSDTTPLGGAGVFMSPSFSAKINAHFVNNFIVPGNPVIVSIPMGAWNQLERFPQFTKANYTGPKLPFTEEGINLARTWHGKHWICDPSLPEVASNIIQGYAWTPISMAEVFVKDITVIWTWENTEDVWFGNHNFAQGNKIIPALKKGVLPIKIDVSIDPEDIDPETYEVAA